MDDKELLALAAKAAGYALTRVNEDGWHYVCGYESTPMEWELWDPLTDDADAFRLAVKLQIIVGKYDNYANASVIGESDIDVVVWSHQEKDPYAATRRAIVRAAAEIGEYKYRRT